MGIADIKAWAKVAAKGGITHEEFRKANISQGQKLRDMTPEQRAHAIERGHRTYDSREDGDWKCQQCGANVWASKPECFKCLSLRPLAEPEPEPVAEPEP